MPPHGLRRTRGVRYRDDVGFELWCPDCDRFWPADLEFWNQHTLQRCRACEARKRNRHEKARRAALGPAAISARNRAYYAENRALLRYKDNARKAARK